MQGLFSSERRLSRGPFYAWLVELLLVFPLLPTSDCCSPAGWGGTRQGNPCLGMGDGISTLITNSAKGWQGRNSRSKQTLSTEHTRLQGRGPEESFGMGLRGEPRLGDSRTGTQGHSLQKWWVAFGVSTYMGTPLAQPWACFSQELRWRLRQ